MGPQRTMIHSLSEMVETLLRPYAEALRARQALMRLSETAESGSDEELVERWNHYMAELAEWDDSPMKR
jgi:hypothetical protein